MSPRRGAHAVLDRLTLLGIAAGAGLLLQPWWPAGFRAGFFVTAAATLAQIVVSHWPAGPTGAGGPTQDAGDSR